MTKVGLDKRFRWPGRGVPRHISNFFKKTSRGAFVAYLASPIELWDSVDATNGSSCCRCRAASKAGPSNRDVMRVGQMTKGKHPPLFRKALCWTESSPIRSGIAKPAFPVCVGKPRQGQFRWEEAGQVGGLGDGVDPLGGVGGPGHARWRGAVLAGGGAAVQLAGGTGPAATAGLCGGWAAWGPPVVDGWKQSEHRRTDKLFEIMQHGHNNVCEIIL